MICWWCGADARSRTVIGYEAQPVFADLNGLVVAGVTHTFSDGKSRGVCQVCLDRFVDLCLRRSPMKTRS